MLRHLIKVSYFPNWKIKNGYGPYRISPSFMAVIPKDELVEINFESSNLVLTFIAFPLRTYVTNVFAFLIGVVISYYLSRRIIFKFSFFGGKLKEFLNFSYTNLISLFAPNLIWFVINFINDDLQKDELWFLLITILINGGILPIKYVIYKFFVFKDSL